MPTIPIPGHKPSTPKNFPSNTADIFDDLLEGFTNNEIASFFKKHEKPVNYMYRDSENFPTVGAGHLIPTIEDALKLPFQYGYDPSSRRPATKDDIRSAYEQLPSQRTDQPRSKRFSAQYYDPSARNLSPLYMNKKDMDALLIDDLRKHKKSVSQKFSAYKIYAPEIQQALLDMEFNMGGNFNREKWPKLFAAIEAEEWATAADESYRDQVGRERNNAIYNLFLKNGSRKSRY